MLRSLKVAIVLARSNRLDGKGSSASEPLEWVEFDWKYTNTYVITEESAGSEKPQLVRPILGAFYDTHNGLVLGHILTTRPISLSLFLLALQRLIMPEAFVASLTKLR